MKIIADNARCEANALCTSADPDLFPLDDEGYISLTAAAEDVPTDKRLAAELGVSLCPVQALRLEA
jgi:ferredoxin